MNILTIDVDSLAATKRRFVSAMHGQTQGNFLTFPTQELLWKTLTPNRWTILQALTGAGPVTIREAARRVQRDVKAVHTDITALLNAGVLDKTADGRIQFAYDAIHVDFMMQAAA